MLLLLLPDAEAGRNLLCQVVVDLLGALLAVFHELEGKGKAQGSRQEAIPEDLALFRLGSLFGIGLPNVVMPLFFLCDSKQGFPVVGVLLPFSDGGIDVVFGKLIPLHGEDDPLGPRA